MPKAYKAFNYVDEDGVQHKFAPGDDVPEEIAEKVTGEIFQPPANEELFTDGNADTELVGADPHAESAKAEDDEEINDNLNRMTVPQLVKLANDRNLEVPDNPKKRDLLKLLRDDAAQ